MAGVMAGFSSRCLLYSSSRVAKHADDGGGDDDDDSSSSDSSELDESYNARVKCRLLDEIFVRLLLTGSVCLSGSQSAARTHAPGDVTRLVKRARCGC